MKKCPFCAEEINAEAIQCPACHERLAIPPAPIKACQSRTVVSMLVWCAGSFVGLFLLGWLYSFLCNVIPLVVVAFPFIYGALAGLLSWMIIKFYRLESPAKAFFIALICAIVAIWTAWIGSMHGWSKSFIVNPFTLWEYADAILELRTIEVNKIQISGGGLVLVWLTEMGMILWSCIASMRYLRHEAFFCPHCQKWATTNFSSPLLKESGDSAQLAQQWQQGDFNKLTTLELGDKKENHIQVKLFLCEACPETRLTLIATATRIFRGVFRDFKYILKHPSAAQAVKGATIETDVVMLDKVSISRSEADAFRKHVETLSAKQ